MRRERLRELIRASWIDIAWVAFVGRNLTGMHVIPDRDPRTIFASSIKRRPVAGSTPAR